MNNVTWNTGAGDQSATYAYAPNSDLLDSLTMGGLTTDYAYEPQRNVKTQVKHTFSNADVVRYDYTYNAAARRDHVGMTPDLPDTAVPSASAITYTPDNLNQYDAIDKDGAVDHPVYDDDGNMITAVIPAQAGIQSPRQFTWDGENRLIAVTPQTPAEGDKKVEFIYDYMSRRVQKKVFTFASGAWEQAADTRFVYDGWNLIQELDGSRSRAKGIRLGAGPEPELAGGRRRGRIGGHGRRRQYLSLLP